MSILRDNLLFKNDMDYCTDYLSTHNFNFSKFMQIEVLANFLLWRVQLHGQLNFIKATVEAFQAAKNNV